MTTYNDYRISRFLQQRDVEKPILAEIAGWREEIISPDDEEPSVLILFKGLKPLVLKPVNNALIASIAGTDVFEEWTGLKIVLYVDKTISFGGRITGGIRCRAPKGQTVPQPKPQTFDHNKSIENLRNAQKAAGLNAPPVSSPEQDALAAEIVNNEQYKSGADDEV